MAAERPKPGGEDWTGDLIVLQAQLPMTAKKTDKRARPAAGKAKGRNKTKVVRPSRGSTPAPRPRDAGRLLAAIVESADEAIIGKTLDGIVTAWNPSAERIFGYAAVEMIGQPISLIAAPDRRDEMPSILERIRRGETVDHLQTVRRRKDGTLIDISLTVSPIKDARGRIVGASKIARDITSEKEREGLLRTVLDAAPDALVVIDEKGIMRAFSAAGERIFGHSTAEVIGKNVSMLMPPPYRQDHDGYLARYINTGRKRIIGIGRIVVAQRKDGSNFPIELSVGEVNVAGRHLFAGFIRDLTERQQAERRLQELQQQLTHMSRLSEMGQMASALAHEINQPLAATSNYIQAARRLLARGDAPSLERANTALNHVSAQVDRTVEIIKRLRSFVHKGAAERQPEDIVKVIEEASALALIGVGEHRAKVRLALQPELPLLMIDKIQIQQVVVNLMRNAVEAMETAPRRELTARAELDGDGSVAVSIIDTGPGLAPEVAGKLFSPFVTTKAHGMGIGLSICRTIVEAHGGRMSAEPNPGGGTVFRFTLPVAAETDDPASHDKADAV